MNMNYIKTIFIVGVFFIMNAVNATVVDTIRTRVIAELMITVNATQVSTVIPYINPKSSIELGSSNDGH
jgi:hypothetical protein